MPRRRFRRFIVQFLRIFKNGEKQNFPENRGFEILYRIRFDGGVAQLGEHLPCKQGVMGSNPIISTTTKVDPKKGNEPATIMDCSSGG